MPQKLTNKVTQAVHWQRDNMPFYKEIADLQSLIKNDQTCRAVASIPDIYDPIRTLFLYYY